MRMQKYYKEPFKRQGIYTAHAAENSVKQRNEILEALEIISEQLQMLIQSVLELKKYDK